MALVYPAELPVPQTSTVTPVERRALSDADYPREAVAIERDRMQIEEITLPPMQADQLAVFWAWWRNELVYGGAWFAATWPLPVGMVTAVRKFVGTPQREYIAPGFWRITAVCEVRGIGVIPTDVPEVPTSFIVSVNTESADLLYLDEYLAVYPSISVYGQAFSSPGGVNVTLTTIGGLNRRAEFSGTSSVLLQNNLGPAGPARVAEFVIEAGNTGELRLGGFMNNVFPGNAYLEDLALGESTNAANYISSSGSCFYHPSTVIGGAALDIGDVVGVVCTGTDGGGEYAFFVNGVLRSAAAVVDPRAQFGISVSY